jgi:hypothetical protein
MSGVSSLPSPAGIAALSVASLLVTAVVVYVVGRVGYLFAQVVLPPLRRLGGLLVPQGPAGFLAVLLVFTTAVVFGVAAPLPDRVGTLGDGGAGGAAGGFLETAFEERDGVVRAEDGTVRLSGAGYDRPEPDTAGDRLRDDWLRAGRAPGGAPLPDGSVGRLDLYVVVVHGSNVEPLTGSEKRQLRAVWAEMPVENPDGSTGIDVHVVSGGQLDAPVRFGSSDSDDHTRYYTEDVMGARQCRYHLVVLGEPTSRFSGWGTTPGYSAFATGVRNPDYRGNVSYRVRVMTHELLHNVVGHINDPGLPDRGAHTREGWLGGDEYLSDATAAQLNETRFRGPGLYQNEICGDGE